MRSQRCGVDWRSKKLNESNAHRTHVEINFHIDSQSAIRALEAYTTRLKSVAECKRLLNKLSEDNTVMLNWIPGHSGQLGNGIADGLAKLGAEYPDTGLEPRLPVSNCVTTNILKQWSRNQHNTKWQEATEYRQSKLVLPETTHKWRKTSLQLNKKHLRILTQLVTGHANLKRHRYIMGMEDNPDCNHCGDEQTSTHILAKCPGLAGPRTAILGKPIISIADIKNYNINTILKFAKQTGYWRQ